MKNVNLLVLFLTVTNNATVGIPGVLAEITKEQLEKTGNVNEEQTT